MTTVVQVAFIHTHRHRTPPPVGWSVNYMDFNLLPALQSGFRSGYSTETDFLRVLSDILLAVDRGDLAALILLDLTAVSDTVDHDILLYNAWKWASVSPTSLSSGYYRTWSDSHSTYDVEMPSQPPSCLCGVPPGQSSGPILFIM